MLHIDLYLLGPPRIERDGQSIDLATRKVVALLVYLAVTGEQHTRDALATLLWPELDGTRARAGLRRALSALRKSVGRDNLAISRETAALHPDADLWLDVAAFHAHLAECETHGHPPDAVCPACLAPLMAAVELVRGDFMAGFTLRDSVAFDDWQFFQAETLGRELAGALERLVRSYSRQGDFEAAIPHARRWLALDPLREEAHRQLMKLYAWSGQRTAALRQYRECVRLLEEELGVAPLEETTALYQAISENQLTTPGPSPVVFEPTAVSPLADDAPGQTVYPLVGRATAWTTLLQTYQRVGPNGELVVLEGEAGIGKTRLAEEFVAYVSGRGATAVAARCYQGEADLAYGPFVEGLRAALAAEAAGERLSAMPPHLLAEAARLLPEMAARFPDLPSPPPLEGPGAQSRFFAALVELLVTLTAGPSAGLLFFDDVHWADVASLDLLTYLARRLNGRSLLIMVTWRPESVPAEGRLRRLLADAGRAGRGALVRLARLSRDEVAELLGAFDAPLPEGTVTRLYHESEGLPFFVIAYLDALIGAGAAADEGEWAMPRGARDLLRARLAAIDETCRQLLQAAAVIGRSFDFETVREASGRSDEEAVAGLETLLALRLIRESPGEGLTYDFSHQKLGELVYDEASLARRRLLHRRVAEALLAGARRRGVIGASAGQVAHHFRQAGQEGEAADYYRLAGEHARTLYANQEALAHFRAALALGYPATAVLHESIGDLYTLLGEYDRALTSYETAAAHTTEQDATGLAQLEHKLGAVHHRRGEWELAESHFTAAEAAQSGDEPGARARLYADWSRTAHHREETERALALARQALQLAEEAGDRPALAQAHNTLGILARNAGDLPGARRHLEESLTLADEPGGRLAALNNLALVAGSAGDTAGAERLLEEALALCVTLGDRHREAALHNNLADLMHQNGREEAAMAHLKTAVAIYAEIGGEAVSWQPEIWKLTEW